MNEELTAIAWMMTDNHNSLLTRTSCSRVRVGPAGDYIVNLDDHRNVWSIFGVLVEGGLDTKVGTGYVEFHHDIGQPTAFNGHSHGSHYFAHAMLYGLQLLSQKEEG